MNLAVTPVTELLGEPPELPSRLHGGLQQANLDAGKSALLCVDMQRHVATSRSGPKQRAAAALGLEAELAYYWQRVDATVTNLSMLQRVFRNAGLEVIHTMGSLATIDGRDRGRAKSRLRAGRVVAAPGAVANPEVTGESPIIDAVAPLPNELVFRKNGATAFGMTRIDLVLWQLGIETLVVGGVVTHHCVEATVRGAFDHGFNVVLLHDATATYSERLQEGTVRSVGDWFCSMASSDAVARWVEEWRVR